MRPVAIAAHLGVDHDHVAQDVLAAHGLGRSILTFGENIVAVALVETLL